MRRDSLSGNSALGLCVPSEGNKCAESEPLGVHIVAIFTCASLCVLPNGPYVWKHQETVHTLSEYNTRDVFWVCFSCWKCCEMCRVFFGVCGCVYILHTCVCVRVTHTLRRALIACLVVSGIYIHTYVYMYMHICIYMHTYICIYIYIYIHSHTHTHTHTHAHTHTHTHTHTYMYIYIYIYLCIYVNICIYINI